MDIAQLSKNIHMYMDNNVQIVDNFVCGVHRSNELLNLLYANLKQEQQVALYTLHSALCGAKNSILLIDAKPGTGNI
jgi:hypothetical protein